ncbi:hypothetical protein [Alicyclobacillus sendaiensis]|nr:hypothetical protein [Alicyclobacillus sendaiensis]
MTTTTDLTLEITKPILDAMKTAARFAPKKYPVRATDQRAVAPSGATTAR